MSTTHYIEYARACTALRSTQVAIAQLQVARHEIAITAGEQRAAVRMLDAALLEAQRAQADIETTIRALGRAAQST